MGATKSDGAGASTVPASAWPASALTVGSDGDAGTTGIIGEGVEGTVMPPVTLS